ncbi:MAG: polyprenol monophosphomannose synthase [Brevinemataceae bacterium]
MMKGTVIIPTYNEKGNIERIIPLILEQSSLDVLVVDDNSPDGTADLVKAEKEFGRRVFLLERKEKDGLGRAYIAGFKRILEQNYDFAVQMDADLSHDPKELKKFVDALESGSDAVFGSRYINGVRVLDWDLKRLLLSIAANFYAKCITGVSVSDLTGGYNAYNRKVLESINLENIRAKGYMFQIEMKSLAYYSNFSISEVPIVFIDRTVGQTKLQGSIIYEAIFGCIWIRLRFLLKKIFG